MASVGTVRPVWFLSYIIQHNYFIYHTKILNR